jgi:hypothetical protein
MVILLHSVVEIVILVSVFREGLLLAEVLPPAVVELQDVLLDVGAVVGGTVPPGAGVIKLFTDVSYIFS